MRIFIAAVIAAVLTASVAAIPTLKDAERTTADRITEYNYPVESHKVHTEDGYILTFFRIPYSPKLQNQNAQRPVAFIQHGVLDTSDDWILSGPNDALAYLFADAGYDVWLGNSRGSTYSRQHETLSTWQEAFWDFSWDETGFYDIPASIDYVLAATNQTGLHYVGHSMGTTIFLVAMSLRPEYNAKIKTSHLLAPVAYIGHIKSPVAVIAAPIVENLPLLQYALKDKEILPYVPAVGLLLAILCSDGSLVQPLCVDALNLVFGLNSNHLNTTLLPDASENHPAGTSTNTFLHYAQTYESKRFQRYDYGQSENMRRYNQLSPPDYDLSNVVAPVRLYYGDNDYFSDVGDVQMLASQLPNLVENFNVPYPDWNHIDFLFALEVKDTINDKIIAAANQFEATGDQ